MPIYWMMSCFMIMFVIMVLISLYWFKNFNIVSFSFLSCEKNIMYLW